MERRGWSFESCGVMKSSIVTEVERPSRLRKFTERQLMEVLWTLDAFRPLPWTAIDKVVQEMTAAHRLHGFSPCQLSKILSTPSLQLIGKALHSSLPGSTEAVK